LDRAQNENYSGIGEEASHIGGGEDDGNDDDDHDVLVQPRREKQGPNKI